MQTKDKAVELYKKHKEMLDKIVEDLPEGYIKNSARLEINGILWSLNDIDGEVNMGNYIDWWEEVLEDLNYL